MKSSYNDLLNKYNIALQKLRDLNGRYEDRVEENKRLTAATKHTEKLTRELCEKILAKDRSEMPLGKEYVWSKIGIDELINKTKKCFDSYTIQIVENYDQIADKNSELERKISSLEDQIDKTLESGSISYNSKEELEKAVQRDKEREEKEKKMKPSVKEVVTEGNMKIIDDSTSLETEEEDLFEGIAKIYDSVNPTPRSKGLSTKQRTKAKKDVQKKTHEVSVSKIADGMNDVQKDIMLLIGKEGLSKYKDIETRLMDKNIKQTTIRMNIRALTQAQILELEQVATPTAKIAVYYLNPLGKRTFETLFPEETLVISEAEDIIAEHDNLSHGYGIMYTANELRSKANVKKVIDHNRNHPIKVGGEVYIPDIICEMNNGTLYFEYEMGTHTTADFNTKLNKMRKVTKIINIIFPNRNVLTDVEKKVARFIERMGPENLKGITIRLATFKTIQEMEFPRKNNEWDRIFKPAEAGKNPVVIE